MFSSRNILPVFGRSRIAVAAAVSVACVIIAGPSSATTVAVQCPGQSINAAIAAAFSGQGSPPALDRLTINVKGTCTENVETPPLREVWIVGQGGALLQPASPNAPALEVHGGVTIRNLTVRSSLANNDRLIGVGPLAFLAIESSIVTSSTVNNLFAFFENSQGEIGNSTLTGGTDAALFIADSSHVAIYANHGNTVIRRPGAGDGQAIGCYQGSFRISANHPPASVTIGPSPYGISSRGCTAVIHPDSGTTVKITGASHLGIESQSGDSYSLVRTTLTGNSGPAIDVSAGAMEIDSSSITSGIASRRGAVIRFNNIYGPSSVTDGEDDPYTCYQYGRIFSEPDYISSEIGEGACIQIGEPG